MEFLLHLYVVTSVIVSCSGRESYTIGRNSPRYKSDVLQLPSSMCSVSGSKCKSFHKEAFSAGGTCKCACPYGAATFGWYEGKWTCIDNSEVRKQSGCTYRFQSGDSKTSPLKVMKKGEADSVDLTSSSCKINFSSSRYLNCDGTWDGLGLNQNSGNDVIEFKSKKSKWKTRDESDLTYKLKIKKIKGSLAGQVVKLQIQCNGLKTSCILFKIFGEITCNENVTSTPTRTPPTTSQISSTKIVTSDPTSVTSSVTTNPNDSAKNDKTKESGGSSTAVGVVVTMVIIVAIVIANIAYVFWKRKRGESVWLVDQILLRVRKCKSSPPKKTEGKTFEDPEYAEIPEEQRRNGPVDQPGDIYSYAFDDPHTAYGTSQPAPYNKLVHNKQEADQDGAIYSSADDGPVYNVLERPLDGEVIIMTSKTSGNTVNDGHLSEDPDQIYHALEEPDATDETTDTRNDGHDVRASTGTAIPSGRLNKCVAPKVRRTPPSPPRKI